MGEFKMAEERWQKWSEAAARIQAAEAEAARKETERIKEATKNAEERIEKAAQALGRFLNGFAGMAAKTLLAASKKQVVLTHGCMGSDSYPFYFIDEYGTGRTLDRSSTWVPLADRAVAPFILRLSPYDFVRECFLNGGRRPDEILPWIHSELDRIAAEAPPKA